MQLTGENTQLTGEMNQKDDRITQLTGEMSEKDGRITKLLAVVSGIKAQMFKVDEMIREIMVDE